MERKCVTYNSSKPIEVARDAVVANCEAILLGNRTIKALRKLCGSIVYNFLFLIPSHLLEDGKNYTLEAICVNVKGLLNYSVHDMLNDLGSVCTEDAKVLSSLQEVLHSCLYGETFSLVSLNTKDTYMALLLCYLNLKSLKDTVDEAVQIYRNTNTGYLDLWMLFEREVYSG